MKAKKINRLDGTLTRQYIIEKSLEPISEIGFANIKLTKLANIIRISPSQIIYHFQTLEGLFKELVIYVVNKGREMADSQIKFSKKNSLELWIDSMLDWLGTRRDYQSIMIQFYSQALFNK